MKPNILLIISDDCTYNDLPLYGGRNAKTPHIDQLGREGLVFERAHLGMAMCMPCRAELYTGLYPMRNSVSDPFERSNLANDPGHARIRQFLSTELDRWMAEQSDQGIPLDTREAHRAAREGKHLYGSLNRG